MRYPPEETAEKHQRILAEASRLLREHGLSGVSVGDLMQAAGLTHGAFYNHFASKPAMIADCIDHLLPQAVQRIESAPRTQIGKRNFIKRYLSPASRDNPGQACLMSSLGGEVAREPAARGAMTRYIKAFIETVTNHFPWTQAEQARGDAIRLTATMVGALVLARAVDDEALAREILREAIASEADAAAE